MIFPKQLYLGRHGLKCQAEGTKKLATEAKILNLNSLLNPILKTTGRSNNQPALLAPDQSAFDGRLPHEAILPAPTGQLPAILPGTCVLLTL